jgi:DNA-binding transcriptional MocR family regulator
MRDVYQQRRRLLLESLHDKLGEWLQPIPSFYGMHIAAVSGSVNLEVVAYLRCAEL